MKKYYYTKRKQSRREIENYWKYFENCKKVLDLGCGIGSFGEFKPSGVEVYGIDSDENALIKAEKFEKTTNGDVSKKLPYKDNFFDGILAKDILEHVLFPWELVREMQRVLKKNGVVLAIVPSPGKKTWEDYTHVRPFTERSIRELFLDNGFYVEFVKRTRGIPGFGITGLSAVVPYILRFPGLGCLTQGYIIKARKLA